jgi:membrane protein
LPTRVAKPMASTSESKHNLLWRLYRFVLAVVRRFYEDRCLLHASALTYTSLLSLVPLLALMFAVLKGLGVQRRLEPLLLSRLALSTEATQRIMIYIDRTNVGTLGALGAVALLGTVISVLGSVEASFNHIWRVRHSRSWWRKATDYLGTLLLTPFLLLAAVAITSSLHEQSLLHWMLHTEYVREAVLKLLRLAPFAINAVALAILYSVMPNRRPYVPAIAVGAFTAGCVWQLVQWSYVTLQVGVARYNAIYGALSQLPIILVWLYVSWAVVLGGAELAAAWEFGPEDVEYPLPALARWAIALHVLVRAADAFRDGATIVLAPLARELRIDRATVIDIAEQLRHAGLLAAVNEAPDRYVLGREPATIDLAMVDGLVDGARIPEGCDRRVSAVLEALTDERRAKLRRRHLADLLGDPDQAPSR